MSGTLEGLEVVMNMIDNILVFRITQEEHDRRLCQVMQRLQDAGVRLDRGSAFFSAHRVKFLFVIVSAEAIPASPKKIIVIMSIQYQRVAHRRPSSILAIITTPMI